MVKRNNYSFNIGGMMKGTKKRLLISMAVLALAGVIVLAGNAVQSAKAAFNVPFFATLKSSSTSAPELGVVELKGTVDAVNAESYTISGMTFRFDTLTIISGAPVAGDSVEVKALTLPDLTRYALKIEKKDAVFTTPEFEFYGLVETMSAAMWTISSEQVQIDLTTVVDPGIAAGALVEVKGTVVAGQMLADSIELKESMPGDVGTEVELFGTVESISGAVYMIGGKTVNTDASTEFVGAVVVGSFVKIHASLNTDGTYLAREIELISAAVVTPGGDDDDDQDEDQDDQGEDEDEQEIKITGVLESMAAGLWVVDGVEFVVNDTTKIEGDPQVGDTVKVEAHVQTDGTNLAHEIELEEDESVGDDDDSSNNDDDEDSDDSDSDDDDHDDDDDDDDRSGGGDDDDDDEDDDDSGTDSSGFTS